MPAIMIFKIDLNKNNQEIVLKFEVFLNKYNFNEAQKQELLSEFKKNMFPRISRMRDLVANGSNIVFSKSLQTELGELRIEIGTTKKTFAARILDIFRN